MIHLKGVPPTAENVKLFEYQPFRFDDGTITGAALGMTNGSPLRASNGNGVDPADWQRFLQAAEGQARQYDDLLDFTESKIGSFNGLSFADVAGNAGYSSMRARQRGAASATSFDAGAYGRAIELANDALGLDVRFVQAGYDMTWHKMASQNAQFDIVSNVSFMCHSSDPQFLLHYLGSMARKAVLIYSIFSFDDEYSIKFSDQTSRYFGGKFPICFDATTKPSGKLIRFGLESMGFTVHEMEHQPHWVPCSNEWRAYLGVRS